MNALAWPPALCLLFLALAGCSSTEPALVADAAALPVVPEVHILPGGSIPSAPGPFYSLADLQLTAPATVRIVNDDNTYHRIMGQVSSAQAPTWAVQALGPAGHAHGGPSVVVDAELNPGEAIEVAIPLDGELGIHCHPHPWMLGHWSVAANGTKDYPVAAGSLRRAGEASGELSAGASMSFDIPLAQNVRGVRANLTWDDSVNDGPTGEAGNSPDTLRLELRAPGGEVVASHNATARAGFIEVNFTAPTTAWPESVTAATRGEAEALLRAKAPDDMAWAGLWLVRVELVAAPGPIPDVSGTLNPVPSTDGKQPWTMQVLTTQEWVVIGLGEEVLHGNWEFPA